MRDTHISSFIDSVIPVITKCQPKSRDDKNSLEYIKDEIYEIMCDHFKMDVKEPQENDYDEDFEFLEKFCNQVIIYDPLDRKILD